VTGIENQFHLDGPQRVVVTYLYREGFAPCGPMNRKAEALTSGKRPVAATVSSLIEPLDISTSKSVRIRNYRAACEIEVTWA
jgi:hypothetical protein